MSDLITYQLPNETRIKSVNFLTHSVCFKEWLIIKWAQTLLCNIANTEYPLESLANYHMNPQSAQYNGKHTVSALSNGQLPNEPKKKLNKICNT